jgi:folate-binding protein YgfZ
MSDPLHDLHVQAEAEFQAYGDVQIVSTFGEPQAEYAAIHKSAAVIDLPYRGLLHVTGKDRLPFLNNLLSNQTWDKNTKSPMAAGTGVYAYLLDAKTGRVRADMNVIERDGDTLAGTWIETDARLIPMLAAALEKYRFAESVKFADRSAEYHEIAVHGPDAVAPPVGVPDLAPMASATFATDAGPGFVWRDDPTGQPGYHIVIPVAAARAVWMNLITSGNVRPTGWAAFNATRVEAGRPLFGVDFDEQILPGETGPSLARAVSFTKGCYPGQEVVARMHARKAMAKSIVGLKVADGALPIAGAHVTDDAGNIIGAVTSSTISPVMSNAAIAIALVKRPSFAPGTVVNVPAEGSIRRAVVTELPFVK